LEKGYRAGTNHSIPAPRTLANLSFSRIPPYPALLATGIATCGAPLLSAVMTCHLLLAIHHAPWVPRGMLPGSSAARYLPLPIPNPPCQSTTLAAPISPGPGLSTIRAQLEPLVRARLWIGESPGFQNPAEPCNPLVVASPGGHLLHA
jgi:hypothetical protein